MKFLLDANIPYSARDAFPKPHTIFHVRDLGLEDAPDDTIIAWAKKHRAVIVSRDLDFANTLKVPPHRHCGVIVLRLPHLSSAQQIKDTLKTFIATVDIKLLPQSLVIVEEGRFRIRRENHH